jgi:NitT/TauT family transport system permease protein
MSQLQYYLAIVAWGIAAAALALMLVMPVETPVWLLVFAAAGAASAVRLVRQFDPFIDGAIAALGLVAVLVSLDHPAPVTSVFWLSLIAAWLFAWLFVERLSRALALGRLPAMPFGIVVPAIFGIVVLVVWEAVTRGGNVPSVILPPPSAIGARFMATTHLLWADFQQTFLKSVLIGYALGCGAGFALAILIDRSPFLKRGLLPIGNFVSALPIVGIAPIMVMWFGFDWQSKAAVVVVMTTFPMLVNTIAGLNAASVMERDLMRTYAASYWQTLFKLRLPAAAPFIFNALKINSTLALIGAIVAEFFGTPTVGMGFRISTEVGRMNVDMVWAEIAVAALAGSVFYGVVVLIERAVTFWHPSVRSA